MLENFLFLVLGLILLVKGADYFVRTSSTIAKKLGVSELLIGLTLTAIGTSVPELAASISAALQNHTQLITGSVIGSNIANIALIIGIAAIIHSYSTDKKMFLRDGYILILSVVIFYAVAYDGVIEFFEGFVLLVLYLSYLLFLIRTRTMETGYEFHNFLKYFFNFGYITTIKSAMMKRALKKGKPAEKKRTIHLFREGLIKDLIIAIISFSAIIAGAKFFIRESAWLAALLGIPENLVGLSLVAIGTSLPELAVSISAARKGLGSIIIGNVIGSNIANIFLILGVSTLITPIKVSQLSLVYLIPIMGFFTIFLLHFIKSGLEIKRKSGIILLLLYLAFMAFAMYQGMV